jgi:hypothetical protein
MERDKCHFGLTPQYIFGQDATQDTALMDALSVAVLTANFTAETPVAWTWLLKATDLYHNFDLMLNNAFGFKPEHPEEQFAFQGHADTNPVLFRRIQSHVVAVYTPFYENTTAREIYNQDAVINIKKLFELFFPLVSIDRNYDAAFYVLNMIGHVKCASLFAEPAYVEMMNVGLGLDHDLCMRAVLGSLARARQDRFFNFRQINQKAFLLAVQRTSAGAAERALIRIAEFMQQRN